MDLPFIRQEMRRVLASTHCRPSTSFPAVRRLLSLEECGQNSASAKLICKLGPYLCCDGHQVSVDVSGLYFLANVSYTL